MGVAVGILSLGALEVEICLGGNFTPPLDQIKVAKHLGTARVKTGKGDFNVKQVP